MPEVQAVNVSREYETIYVLRPDAGRDSSQRVSDRVRDVFARQAGTLTRVENWGYRKLAYNVQKHTRGVYVYLKYEGDGRVVSELERSLRLQESVIKLQTVATGRALAAAEVKEEDVAFEHLDSMAEPAEEMSLARELGLDETRGDELLSRQRAAEAAEDDLDNDDDDQVPPL
jgi:small subunit ribosomal protein S6